MDINRKFKKDWPGIVRHLVCRNGLQNFRSSRFFTDSVEFSIPIGSMYGIYTNIGGILMVNVTIYSIHGSYGIEFSSIDLSQSIQTGNFTDLPSSKRNMAATWSHLPTYGVGSNQSWFPKSSK